jgi:hypothetical protein
MEEIARVESFANITCHACIIGCGKGNCAQ